MGKNRTETYARKGSPFYFGQKVFSFLRVAARYPELFAFGWACFLHFCYLCSGQAGTTSSC